MPECVEGESEVRVVLSWKENKMKGEEKEGKGRSRSSNS